MREREWLFRLEDMHRSAQRIEQYTRGLAKSDFADSEKTIDAVLHNLIIIGQAANNIPEEVKTRLLDLPWHEIRGIRNRLVHDYPGTDFDIIWQTVTEDIPALEVALRNAIAAEMIRRGHTDEDRS